jgi:hypothetical protein
MCKSEELPMGEHALFLGLTRFMIIGSGQSSGPGLFLFT